MRHHALLLALFLPLALFAQWQNTNGPLAGGASAFTGNADYLFAANIAGVFRSADGGVTWENTSSGLSPDNNYYDVQANGDQVLVTGRHTYFYGAANLVAYLSPDNGGTWTELPLPFFDANFLYGIALAGDKLYAANGTGVWERPVGGGDWVPNALDSDPDAFLRSSCRMDGCSPSASTKSPFAPTCWGKLGRKSQYQARPISSPIWSHAAIPCLWKTTTTAVSAHLTAALSGSELA